MIWITLVSLVIALASLIWLSVAISRAKTETSAMIDKVDSIQRDANRIKDWAEKATEEAKKKSQEKRYTQLSTYRFDDPEYIKVLADFSTRPEVLFFLDCIEREIYETVLMCPSDESLVDAGKRAKGVQIVRNKLDQMVALANPEIL